MSAPSILNMTPLAAASGNPISVTIPATTAGSILVIFYVCGNNDATLSSVSGGGGTWASQQSDASSVSSWGILSGVSAGTTSLSLTLSTSDGPTIFVYEIANAGTVDVNATPKYTASATSFTSNSATTTNAQDLVIGTFLGFPVSGTAPTVTPTTSGYTNETTVSNSTSFRTFLQTGHQITSSTGTFSYNATTSNSCSGCIYVISIKGVSGTSYNGDSSLTETIGLSATAGLSAVADSSLIETIGLTGTAGLSAVADSSLTETLAFTGTASVNASADSSLALSLGLTADMTLAVSYSADSSLALGFNAVADATVTHSKLPEFDYTGQIEMPPPPLAFQTIGMPPDEVIAALIAGVVVIKNRRVEIYNSDAITPFDIIDWNARLIDGTVTVDGTRDERRMADLELSNPDGALNLNPYGGFWYDKIVKVFWGIEYYVNTTLRKRWEVQIGEFMIDRIDEDYFPNVCKITCRDYTKKPLISDIKEAISFSNNTPVETIISALAANSGIKKFRMPYTGLAFQDDVVFDPNTPRWAVMKRLADSIGYEVYFTADGYLTMRPYQDPVLSPLAWTFDTTKTEGTLIKYSRTSDDSLLKNHTIVQGASVTDQFGFTTSAYGEAINDDPLSPTNTDRLGDRVDFFKSDYITDPNQAQALAETRLRISSLEEYSINFSSMILPWLEANDIVNIVNDKESQYVPARFLMSNFTLPLALGEMSGVGKRITIAGTVTQIGTI